MPDLFITCGLLVSQNMFAYTYGGADDDIAYSVNSTSDGGLVVAGVTSSFGAGGKDFMVLKLNENRDLSWAKTFGGTDNDWAESVIQTSDGGYVVAGITESFGAGGKDFMVLKLNENGDLSWAKTFGGSYDDESHCVVHTSDRGYVVAGETSSFGSGYRNILVLKLDTSGALRWAKIFGEGSAFVRSLAQTSDGGCIVAGYTDNFGVDEYDFLVFKLNENGDPVWARTFGGTGYDEAYSVAQTSDGEYVVAGGTESFGAGFRDFLVLKINENGDLSWAKSFGTSGDDVAYSVTQISDGSCIITGNTFGSGPGGDDCLVLKLDGDGNPIEARIFGDSFTDGAYSVAQTSDGGYAIAGYTSSFGADDQDFLVLKLDENGDLSWAGTFGGTDYDRAESVTQTSEIGHIVAGETESFGAGSRDLLVVKLASDGSLD